MPCLWTWLDVCWSCSCFIFSTSCQYYIMSSLYWKLLNRLFYISLTTTFFTNFLSLLNIIFIDSTVKSGRFQVPENNWKFKVKWSDARIFMHNQQLIDYHWYWMFKNCSITVNSFLLLTNILETFCETQRSYMSVCTDTLSGQYQQTWRWMYIHGVRRRHYFLPLHYDVMLWI